MYSLYQAWLLRENSSLSSSTMVTIPDTIINVGTGENLQKYSGHKIILSSQSGYLRSLLANQESTPEIYITNVNAEIFGILLTFMYTGYLNINMENIYSVLLATHLLHMPRALDLCRSFLIEQQAIPTLIPPAPLAPMLPANIVKPIPSRKPLPTIIQQPNNQTHLERSFWGVGSSVFHPVQSKTIEEKETLQLTINTQQPSTSKESAPTAATSISSLSPCLSNISGTSDEVTVTIMEHNSESSKKRTKASTKNLKSNEENSKVIIDIASCDGPVKFQRILNINYRAKNNKEHSAREDENMTKGFETDTNTKPASQEVPFHSLNFLSGKNNGDQNEVILRCNYCDHTFKSKYCFQKHTKRHLNSMEAGDSPKLKLNAQPPMIRMNPKKIQVSQPTGSKREVRLLDMNVQYYPCKTCGSKFPSYYFVHKHRKMCHPEEESTISGPSSSENKSNSPENSSSIDDKDIKMD